MTSAPLLDRAGIARLVPHQGAMCLLARLEHWDADRIACTATNHRDADHPLRTASGLLSACAIEYAAQAMALHGALIAARLESDAARGPADPQAGPAGPAAAKPGMLASARDVRLHRLRLDDLPGELRIEAERQAGDARQILYGFRVLHRDEPVAEGRATVVLAADPPPSPAPLPGGPLDAA